MTSNIDLSYSAPADAKTQQTEISRLNAEIVRLTAEIAKFPSTRISTLNSLSKAYFECE